MRIGWATLALALLALGACQTTQSSTPSTASGLPEVTIAGVTPDRVKAELVNVMINRNFRVVKDTPLQLALDAPVTNILASVLLGSQYDSQPVERASFTLIQQGGATRVVADLAIITNPGSAFEMRTTINGGTESAAVQLALDDVRVNMDPNSFASKAKAKGIILGVHPLPVQAAKQQKIDTQSTAGLYVTGVDAGSPAAAAGVAVGDVIIAVDGKTTNSTEELAQALYAVPVAGTARLTIERAGKPTDVKVQFKKAK